jgi:hypothetical protein
MNDSDKKDFKELFDGIAEYYRQDKLSKIALQVYFGALQGYSLEQVSQAASKHLVDTKAGQYFPKAADIIKHLEGHDITTDQLIAMARAKNCPLGVLAAIHIGSFDLQNCTDMFYLRQRAEEVLLMLDNLKKRSISGEFTDHEVSTMLKYGVSPSEPLVAGFIAPPYSQVLEDQKTRVEASERHRANLLPAYDGESKDLVPASNVGKFINAQLN